MRNGKNLWMRHVDFENIKDMLHLVRINDGLLGPSEFDNVGVTKDILIKKHGRKPLARSTRYNYRKVMENLGIIELNNNKYYVSTSSAVKKLLDVTIFHQPMSEEGKEILRNIILSNDDCRKHFFDLFMEDLSYDLHGLREKGMPIFVETPAMRRFYLNSGMMIDKSKLEDHRAINKDVIILRNLKRNILELRSADEIYAIYWGVRRWSAKLDITNEIIIDFEEGRIIYPINPIFNEKEMYGIISKHIISAKSDNEWIIIPVPYFIRSVIMETRFPLNSIKKFLLDLKNKYPSLIMFIPTSTIFIDIKTPYNSQDHLFRSSYLFDERKRYISHIRINKKLLEMLSK